MHRQTMAFPLYVQSGFPMEKVEQMIMMSLGDVTVIAHATGGGKYIRSTSSSFGPVIWVSGTEQLGSQPFAADCIGRINCYFGVRAHQFT